MISKAKSKQRPDYVVERLVGDLVQQMEHFFKNLFKLP